MAAHGHERLHGLLLGRGTLVLFLLSDNLLELMNVYESIIAEVRLGHHAKDLLLTYLLSHHFH